MITCLVACQRICASRVLAYRNDDLTILHDHEVVVEDGMIVAVRERRPGRDARIEAHGQLLLPGLISGHTHSAAGSATRGYIELNPPTSTSTTPKPARSFLRTMELMDSLDPNDLDDLTAYNLAEILRGGCTTQVEMSLSLKQAQSYVRVARRYGVRGFVAGMVPASIACSRSGGVSTTKSCSTQLARRSPRSTRTSSGRARSTAPKTDASER